MGEESLAVTELIESSVGANRTLASRSQNRQKTLPPRKHAGIITSGFAVRNRRFISCGTAIPTKEIGPANAVTQADRTLESRIRMTLWLTPGRVYSARNAAAAPQKLDTPGVTS